LYAVQDSMFFFNVMDEGSREFLRGRPGYSEVEFTAGGRTYHGMMHQASGEAAQNGVAPSEVAPLVIYFGGNGEVSYRKLRGIEEMGQWEYFAGYHYLYIDYEGYGLNDGQTGQRSMYEGALAVYDYAAALPDVDSGRIVAMGYSLGTGCAVYLAANRPVAGLVLAAPYAKGVDLYNNVLPIFYGPMEWLVKQKIPSEDYAPSVACPALVIASRSDETVPYLSSERLAALFSGGVDFMALENEGHNQIFGAAGVYSRVQDFLEEAASQ
jgi:pimeloyl-ACP methyl ester carboxylesterase